MRMKLCILTVNGEKTLIINSKYCGEKALFITVSLLDFISFQLELTD